MEELISAWPNHVKDLPRVTVIPLKKTTIHVFTDASSVAFAAVAYEYGPHNSLKNPNEIRSKGHRIQNHSRLLPRFIQNRVKDNELWRFNSRLRNADLKRALPKRNRIISQKTTWGYEGYTPRWNYAYDCENENQFLDIKRQNRS
ncbi:unnamed protein product [Acanthocheilonema viteae]|uniref:Uncharacterized protein n=1 Tax=Acanthocheilonema viteae TaxID=6277 RepID=A0A498S966_ACAVI|nr:unnamed protein product [Acanthocheilonema viteae]